MKSSVLCVIAIRLLSPVYAQDPSLAPEQPQMTKSHLECIDETGVSIDEILYMRQGVWHESAPDLRAWVHCVLVKNGLMTKEGVFRQDVAFRNVRNLDKPAMEEKIDKCLPTKAMLPIDISWMFAKCLKREDPKHSLF